MWNCSPHTTSKNNSHPVAWGNYQPWWSEPARIRNTGGQHVLTHSGVSGDDMVLSLQGRVSTLILSTQISTFHSNSVLTVLRWHRSSVAARKMACYLLSPPWMTRLISATFPGWWEIRCWNSPKNCFAIKACYGFKTKRTFAQFACAYRDLFAGRWDSDVIYEVEDVTPSDTGFVAITPTSGIHGPACYDYFLFCSCSMTSCKIAVICVWYPLTLFSAIPWRWHQYARNINR